MRLYEQRMIPTSACPKSRTKLDGLIGLHGRLDLETIAALAVQSGWQARIALA
jgi:hypothetical protein